MAPHEPALDSIEAGTRRRSCAVVIGPAGVGKTGPELHGLRMEVVEQLWTARPTGVLE